MDDPTFDASATDPVFETSRRRLLGGLVGGSLAGAFGLRETEADRKRRSKHDNKSQDRRRDQGDKRRGEGKSKVEGGSKRDGSASTLAAGDSPQEGRSPALKVLTRNLYFGASLAPIFSLQDPNPDLYPRLLEEAVSEVFAMVQATNFPERAKALADEIVEIDAHIVGLQEVALWRSGPKDSIPPGAIPPYSISPNAETVEYDFLTILLDELARRGKSYDVVARVQNADAEGPALTSLDYRITDYEVMLARTDLPKKVFSVTNPQSGNFPRRLTLTIPNAALGSIALPRGWVAADVNLDGETIRVVSTHLERFHPGIQVAQANELLAGPLNTTGPTVLLGDLNSDANGGGTPRESDTPTYSNMLKAGFADAWTTTRGTDVGATWGHDEDLRNPTPSLTERIDFVLTRGGLTASSANRVGHEPEDRTPSGLWPSDHAGVWAVLHLEDA
jgi:endonuclease/exonuclease/phosphatase family metal-dependent hydrolase